MGRPELAQAVRERRRRLKEVLAEALARARPAPTSDQIARQASRYLPASEPLTTARVNHFRAIGEGNLRAPGSAAVATALFWALDDLGVFAGPEGEQDRAELARASEDLGCPPGERPPVRAASAMIEIKPRPAGAPVPSVRAHDDDPRHTTDFRELWVFSRAPAELTKGGYRVDMEEVHFHDPTKTLAYFLPPGDACDDLCSMLRQFFDSANSKDKARVFVVECPAIKLVPHYVIKNPGRRDERGEVRVVDTSGEHSFCHLEADQTSRIVSSVLAAGIGRDRTRFAPSPDDPSTVDPGRSRLEYRLVYASRD